MPVLGPRKLTRLTRLTPSASASNPSIQASPQPPLPLHMLQVPCTGVMTPRLICQQTLQVRVDLDILEEPHELGLRVGEVEVLAASLELVPGMCIL